MLTFQEEHWNTVSREIGPLWKRHWQEIAHNKDRIPLDPNWNGYEGIAASNALYIVTARDDGKLVGYLFAFVTPHMHYQSTVCAFYDLFWLAPEHRKGWAGYRLMKAAEDGLKARGVVKVFGQTKIANDMSAIYRRLGGWKPVEVLYSKMLQE